MEKLSVCVLLVHFLHFQGSNGQEGCGQIVSVRVGSEGLISSPGYPGPYPPKGSCTYRFNSVPSSNHVTLNFVNFNMEPHRACSFDYLSVFDGPSTSSRLIGKYCGSEVPPSITGSGSYLTVYFHSDSSVQGDGFQFRYTVGCTYTFTDTQGTFTSPGYPSNYPQSSDCTYNIQPSSGNQILLSFVNLEMEESSDCNFDNLILYSGVNGSESYRYCGTRNPFNVLVSASKLTMKFHSDRSVSRPGFNINYRIISSCSEGNGGCQHNCTDIGAAKVRCSCAPGYRLQYDANCIDINECSLLSPCEEQCINTAGSYRCGCLRSGYILSPDGRTCTDMTCKRNNGGCQHVCQPAGNTQYHCACHPGFRLAADSHNCTDINECTTTEPSLMHKCEQTCVNEAGSYYCACSSGFTVSANGRTCEDVDECPNHENTCDHQCRNIPGGWECACFDGYKVDQDDPHMCVDVNECSEGLAPAACATCLNLEGSFDCECSSGYLQNDDNTDCIDINECDENNGGCEQICLNSPGSMKCACHSGYSLRSNTSSTCSDINECAPNDGQGPCDHFCENLDGSFQCHCIGGYNLQESGLECLDVNECDSIAECEQACVNSPGSYKCRCFNGYQNINGSCVDVDECLASPCDQNVISTCSNSIGGFSCLCPPGFVLTNHTVCTDIDECAASAADHGCSQLCVNNPGSYTCGCHAGYTKVGDKGCIDLNECSTNSPCQHDCQNTVGSFICICRPGYYLLGNGYNCSDVNECNEGLHSCDQICVNEIGYHRCLCNQGYSLSTNNATCSDINECEGGSGGCSEGCINSIGSFWCFCQHNGYQLDRDNKTCIDTNECETNNGNCEHICTNTNGSYTCGCDAGYQFNGTHGCSDIDECAFANGNCSQQCVNQPGSYHCECQANFKLDTDNKTCIHCPTCSEFESVAADVANFKSKAVVIEQLINRNIRLSATVASLEDRIARIEASLNLEALPANEHP